MKNVLIWIGIAIVVCWAFLWLSVKIAAAAVHLLLVLGIALVIWGLIQGRRSGL